MRRGMSRRYQGKGMTVYIKCEDKLGSKTMRYSTNNRDLGSLRLRLMPRAFQV